MKDLTKGPLHIAYRWDDKLDPLQKLCVLRCVRPDKVVPSMQQYVTHYIGERFIQPPPFDLNTSFRDSVKEMAIVFVLSPGADPSRSKMKWPTPSRKDFAQVHFSDVGADPYDAFLKFAAEVKMSKKCAT